MVYLALGLFFLIVLLAGVHLCQVLYEKFFFYRIHDEIREYVSQLFPDAISRQERNEPNPELFLNARSGSLPVELHFIPGEMSRDIPHPSTLKVTISSQWPYSFSIAKRSLKPWDRLLQILTNHFTDNKMSKVLSNSFGFDFRYCCRSDEARQFRSIIQSNLSRTALLRCLPPGVEKLDFKNGRLTAFFVFTRYSERPKHEVIHRVIDNMSQLAKQFELSELEIETNVRSGVVLS